eukprot:TRINITY_DN2046_c0_g1_i3.p1 TRINITY_DN2046_c0_g1~~TRINITY_DN2046_c0_g1_i3.p1  ORF type:complete len:560 (-),score=120.80 TRINITY_DN2046_c0_g1_i3:424-2103(-)
MGFTLFKQASNKNLHKFNPMRVEILAERSIPVTIRPSGRVPLMGLNNSSSTIPRAASLEAGGSRSSLSNVERDEKEKTEREKNSQDSEPDITQADSAEKDKEKDLKEKDTVKETIKDNKDTAVKEKDPKETARDSTKESKDKEKEISEVIVNTGSTTLSSFQITIRKQIFSFRLAFQLLEHSHKYSNLEKLLTDYELEVPRIVFSRLSSPDEKLREAFLQFYINSNLILDMLKMLLKNEITNLTVMGLFLRETTFSVDSLTTGMKQISEGYFKKLEDEIAGVFTLYYLRLSDFETELGVSKEQDKQVKKNIKYVARLTSHLVNRIVDSVSYFPPELFELCQFTEELTLAKFGPESKYFGVSSILFLRFISPMIVSPHILNQLLEMSGGTIPTDQKVLVICTKLIQQISKRVPFEGVDNFLMGFNEMIAEKKPKMENFYDRVLNQKLAPRSLPILEVAETVYQEIRTHLITNSKHIVPKLQDKWGPESDVLNIFNAALEEGKIIQTLNNVGNSAGNDIIGTGAGAGVVLVGGAGTGTSGSGISVLGGSGVSGGSGSTDEL